MPNRLLPRILLIAIGFSPAGFPNNLDGLFRLATAKRACLEGRTQNPKDTDRFATELKKWGRYQIAERPNCDITVAIQAAGGNQISDGSEVATG
jgi:hypothetical protein